MKKYLAIVFVMTVTILVSACSRTRIEEESTSLAETIEESVFAGKEVSEETNMSVETADEETEITDRKPMVMVNGMLYMDTGRESGVEARCGTMDGEITSAVDASEIPTENDQSNFGTGYGYQYGIGNTIEINIDGKWWVYATEELCGYPTAEEMPVVQDSWGIMLSVKNITADGMTLVVTQSGGEPTGELHFGSDFVLTQWNDGTWEDMPYIVEGDVAWTTEAYMISSEGSTEQEIVWKYLYGSLPSGKYRLSKGITNFRGTGDFDTKMYTVEFIIE